MKRIFNLLTIGMVFFIGCSDKQRTVLLDKDTKAVGDISKDTIYNGLIKFYNIQSGKLVSSANYLNGKLNGENIEYNENGTISSKVFYDNEKQNGEANIYDARGKLINKYFSYYGLKVGEDLSYSDGRLITYSFYSFDNKKLLSINYDSIGDKSITDVQEGFFFYTKRHFNTNTPSSMKHAEVFLYTPNPPNYNFKYSLVHIDDKYAVKSEIRKFSQSDRWSVFDIEQDNKTNEKIALKLEINDPNVPKSIVMFKAIE